MKKFLDMDVDIAMGAELLAWLCRDAVKGKSADAQEKGV